MYEDERPVEPPESPATGNLSPAAQWMLAQAAGEAAPERAQGTSMTPLAERERRIVGGLRGNSRLTDGLDDEAAAALAGWGAAMGRLIVADTADMDDATAEGVLQERVRAARKLMLWVNHSVGRAATETNLSEAAALAAVVYGERYRPPDATLVPVRYGPSVRPAEQIGLLRQFIEARLQSPKDDRGSLV